MLYQEQKLSDLRQKSRGQVIRFSDNSIGSRLMAMGILPGSQVEVVSKAPWNSGLYLKIDNHRMALRNAEAACVIVR